MDTNRILAELRAERQRIDQAIIALESLDHAGASTARAASPKRRHMSAAGRKAISDAAKAMWAERKKKTRPRRHMSAATRKRLSALAKQRWAERKKKAKTA
jgi:hypothetical protein